MFISGTNYKDNPEIKQLFDYLYSNFTEIRGHQYATLTPYNQYEYLYEIMKTSLNGQGLLTNYYNSAKYYDFKSLVNNQTNVQYFVTRVNANGNGILVNGKPNPLTLEDTIAYLLEVKKKKIVQNSIDIIHNIIEKLYGVISSDYAKKDTWYSEVIDTIGAVIKDIRYRWKFS